MASQPRILFLARSLNTGGAERQLVALALGLHRSGWDVTVATFYPGGAFEDVLRAGGLPPVCLEKSGRWDILRFTWRLARLVRKIRPHVAHGYLDMANIMLSLVRPASPGTRVVWGVRASDMDAHDYDRFFHVERFLGVAFSRWADLIICNSRAGLDYHASLGYPAGRMVVIPNGIDTDRFRRDEAARDALRAEWGVAPGQKLVGLVGRLDPMKDAENFLHAAALVAPRHDVKFLCIGDGPASYAAELARLGQELGLGDRLVWSAARSDVWRVYNALDLLVSSSSCGEGFSNTVAEAMATGTPCVVTDVGDSAALVGDLGHVVEPRNSGALAAAISDALRAPRGDVLQLRERIGTNFSVQELLRRSLEHLTALAAPRDGVSRADRQMEH